MSQEDRNEKPRNEEQKVTKFRWLVMGLIFLVFALTTADRASIGFAMPYLRNEFNMTNTQSGAILSAFYLGYAFSQLPAGFIVSKFGVRKVLSVAFLAISVCSGMIGFAAGPVIIKYMRGVVGAIQGPIANSLATTINNWFPANEKGTAMGLFMSSSKFGPLVLPMVCAFIIQYWSWRHIFFVLAIPWVLFLALWLFLVKNKPADSQFCSPAEVELISTSTVVAKKAAKAKKPYNMVWLDKLIRAQKVELLDSNAKIFTNWNMIGSALGFFIIVAFVTVMMTWIPTYLVTVKKFDIMNTAMVASAPFAGTVVGNIVGGWLSDNVFNKRRKPLMIFSSIATAIMMYSMVFASNEPILLVAHLFLLGLLFALGYSAFVVYPMALVTKERFPVATALTNTGGQLGGFCAPLVVGMILDKYNWDMVFIVLAVGACICLALVLSIIEPVDDPLESNTKQA
jgi:sugar phosphate permease